MDFIEIVDGEEIVLFSAPVKKGNVNLRLAFVELRQKLVDESAKLTKQLQKQKDEFKALKTPTDEQRQAHVDMLNQFSIDAVKIGARFMVEYANLLLDTKQLETKFKELLTSDSDGPFWRIQDMEEVEEMVASFRERNTIPG